MRVLCTAITSSVSGESVPKSTWVRVGVEYLVTGLLVDSLRRVTLQIIDDVGPGPSWWDAIMFTTTDARIPPNWVAEVRTGGVVDIGPARWLTPGFWESYFDQEPEAIKIFGEELDRMYAQ